MNSVNRKNLFNEIRSVTIPYRDTLHLQDTATFGIEIEALNLDTYAFKKDDKLIKYIVDYLEENNIKKVDYYTSPWIIKTEPTFIYENEMGSEVVSPVLKDTKEDFEMLKNICYLLKEKGASTGYCTGGHIHFGAECFENINVHSLLNLLEMWTIFEDVIYRFSTGEYMTLRPAANYSATPIREDVMDITSIFFREDVMDTTSSFLDFKNLYKGSMDKLIWLFSTNCGGIKIENLKNETFFDQNKKTIEVRCPNGTLEHTIWQNNINFFYHFLKYALSDNFNEELMDELFLRLNPVSDSVDKQIDNYMNLNIEKAIFLSNLIFDEEIDKLYFLKELLKEPSSKVENGLQKAKKFYK